MAVALATALVLCAGFLAPMGWAVAASAAPATTTTFAAPPKKLVLSSADAAKLGFPVVIAEPTTSTDTGTAFCPTSTYVAYADQGKTVGLTSTVFACTSAALASQLVRGLGKQAATSSALTAPPALGTGAFAQVSPPGYAIWWRLGTRVMQVALNTDISPDGSATPPLTATQRRTLLRAVARQHALVRAK